MKNYLAIAMMLTALSAPAFAQSNTSANTTTNTLLQGLQSFSAGQGTAAANQTNGLSQMKANALAKAGMYAIDADHNGSISKAEMSTLTDKMFNLADTNHDGQLSQQELSTFAADMNKALSLLH